MPAGFNAFHFREIFGFQQTFRPHGVSPADVRQQFYADLLISLQDKFGTIEPSTFIIAEGVFERQAILNRLLSVFNDRKTLFVGDGRAQHGNCHPETAEEAALRVNGMNSSDGVPLDVVRRDFAAWLQDNGIEKIVPLAHNLGFDMKFLLKTFPEASRVFCHRGRDSMRLALAVNDVYQRERREQKFPSASLAAVKDALGIMGEVNHSAFEDAKDAALVYSRLINLMTLA